MSSFGNTRFTTAASTLLLAAFVACTSDRPLTSPDAVPKPDAEQPTAANRLREGFPTKGEVREGFILNRYGKPQQIKYEVQEGLAIYQGDIILGRPSEIATTALGVRTLAAAPSLIGVPEGVARKTVYITHPGFRWIGGVVPYEIDPALPNQDRIPDAIKLIEETTGGITFVPRSGQDDFIKFVMSTGCAARIGRQGGEQDISTGTGCDAPRVAHEMLHALGMNHEMARCDRDSYVEVFLANVTDGKEFNFDKECPSPIYGSLYTDLGNEYDFGSLMQYELDAFSSNGMPTIALRPGVTYSGTIGQRDSLSTLDRITLNWLYGPNDRPPVPVIAAFPASNDEGSAVAMDATGSTDADDKKLFYTWNFGDGSCVALVVPADCTQAMPNHVYKQDGTYKVGLFVYDGYVETATEAYVTVKNVAPSLRFFSTFFPIDEGTAHLSGGDFSDPGADFWTATVNYGDGATSALNLIGKSYLLSHTWADNGSYTVTVDVKDDDVTSTNTATQVVRNVAPTVDAGADQTFTSGQTFSFSGSFTDPGLVDSPWTWSVDWGVGSPTTGSTNTQSLITASNRVCGAGTYNVTLSVTDKDGGKGSDAAQVTVGYLAVNLAIMPGSLPQAPISLRKQGSLPVAIISTATFDARTIDVASLRLGDELGTDTPAAPKKGGFNTSISDVNGDGRLDLVVTFDVPALVSNGDLTMSTTALVLRGKQGPTGDPCINFRGAGTVKVNS